MPSVRVNINSDVFRDCTVGKEYQVIHISQEGECDFGGMPSVYLSWTIKDDVGDHVTFWPEEDEGFVTLID